MKNIKEYIKYLIKCVFAGVAGLVIGYLIAGYLYEAILETKSVYPIHLFGFVLGIVATFAIGIIENRKEISGLADIKNHLGQIVDSGMILSISTVTASATGVIYLIVTSGQLASTEDYLLIISGVVGFLAEGWFLACIVLMPLIIRDMFIKAETFSQKAER